MITRPLIKIKLNLKYLTLEYISNINILIHHKGKILKKQEGRSEGVLEPDDIIQHVFYCTDLVVSHCCIDCISVQELIWVVLFANLILVEDWELGGEELVVLILQNVLDRVAVERQDRYHVGAV
jgi:hypothetical protein